MNISGIISPEQMRERMGEFVADVKTSPMLDDSAEMLVPGELAHRTELQRRRTGVPLPMTVYEDSWR